MTNKKEVRVIFAALAVLFGIFVLGYQGGKQLAMAENSARSLTDQT